MVAGKHAEAEWSARLITPCLQLLTADLVVLQPSESRDGTVNRSITCIGVGFADGEICPQGGNQQLHQFGVLKHLLRGTIKTLEFGYKLRFWQGVDRRIRRG